jgi:hypothetical protein
LLASVEEKSSRRREIVFLSELHQKVKRHVKRHRRGILATLGISIGFLTFAYFGVSYGVLPETWRLFPQDKVEATEPVPRHSHTKEHLVGDPVNLKVAASEEDLRLALSNAGWTTADAIDIVSSLRLAFDTITGHAYVDAPMSNLFLFGHRQDLAYQLATKQGPAKRHHVRFWLAPENAAIGQPVWYGAATFDQGVGVSHNTGQVTHHIAADIDAERDEVMAVLTAHSGAHINWTDNFQADAAGKNGGGDHYYTDRRLAFVSLPSGQTP